MAQIPLSDHNLSSEPLQTSYSSSNVGHSPARIQSTEDAGASWGRLSPPDRASGTLENLDIAEVVVRNLQNPAHGLGLTNVKRPRPSKIKSATMGTKGYHSDGGYTVLPSWTPDHVPSSMGQSAATLNSPYSDHDDHPVDGLPAPQSSRLWLKDSGPSYHHISSEANLLPLQDTSVHDGCPTDGDVLRTRWGWYCTVIVILSLFSTFFSGIFLGIALKKPRWGGLKSMPIETATLLSALFSKLIELSFACVFVATLGQILSRKAFVRQSLSGKRGGVTLAEMNMRLWILQPGTLLTHWTGAWFALRTVLGGVTLLAASSAALYITAAEALVSPKLAFGRNETHVLAGAVSTIYANSDYLNLMCETPVVKTVGNTDEEGPACMQIKHAGQAFRNLATWSTQWTERIVASDWENSAKGRPPPVAFMFDNTTVLGQWFNPNGENITTDSKRYGRLVHNIMLAMPHPNVVRAVRAQRNNILQPEDLKGDGEYYVQAAVPAPALNVLCAGMSLAELDPMRIGGPTGSLNGGSPLKTTVDELFGFTQNRTEQPGDYAPYFEKLPIEFNVVLNKSKSWGQQAVYLLAQPPKTRNTSEYVLCALKSTIYPKCTTTYHVAQAGSELSVHCDDGSHNDPGNTLPYADFEPNAPLGIWDQNWPVIGESWAKAVGLSQGVSDANASIARYLMQLTPSYVPDQATLLDPKFPSLSEALAVLACSTLLISADASPFIHAWTYDVADNWLQTPAWESFHSRVSYKDYTSGHRAPWQALFYVVLIAVFLLNVLCLSYLLWKFCRDGEVTDYTEPQNLFAIAINSPPSHSMSGSCGPGPTGEMLCRKWLVEMSRPLRSNRTTPVLQSQYINSNSVSPTSPTSHPHFYIRCPDDDAMGSSSTPNIETYAEQQKSSGPIPLLPMRVSNEQEPEDISQPYSSRPLSKSNLSPAELWSPNQSSSQRRRVTFRARSVNSLLDDSAETAANSPAVDQYMRLTRHH